jgi:hypothetical protein
MGLLGATYRPTAESLVLPDRPAILALSTARLRFLLLMHLVKWQNRRSGWSKAEQDFLINRCVWSASCTMNTSHAA